MLSTASDPNDLIKLFILARRVVRPLHMALTMCSVMLASHVEAQNALSFYFEHSSQFETKDISLLPSLTRVIDSARTHLAAADHRGRAGDVLRKSIAQPFDYSTKCSIIVPPAIVQTSPAKFLSCQAEFAKAGKDTLIPMWIVRKYGLPRPYYSAIIVARINSSIRDLTPKSWGGIKRLYLADSTSTSGYVAPLHMLWTQGVIDAPTMAAARKKFGDRVALPNLADPRSVKDKVKDDSLAIGAAGEYLDAAKDDSALRADSLKVILRYDLIPQGVIAVTPDLLARQAVLDSVLTHVFRTEGNTHDAYYGLVDPDARVIALSSVGISAVMPFTEEYVSAYRALWQKIRTVRGEIEVGPIETQPRSTTRVLRGLLAFAVLMIVFTLGALVARAMTQRSGPLLYAFLLVVLVAWFLLFYNPKILSSPGFFLFIVLSATLGTTLRALVRLLKTGSKPVESAEIPKPFVEAAAGVVLAFVFTLLFYLNEELIHPGFMVPPAEVDVQRIAIVIAVLSFGAAFLIEDALSILSNNLKRRLGR